MIPAFGPFVSRVIESLLSAGKSIINDIIHDTNQCTIPLRGGNLITYLLNHPNWITNICELSDFFMCAKGKRTFIASVIIYLPKRRC